MKRRTPPTEDGAARQARIEALKRAIDVGTYDVDAVVLAARMVGAAERSEVDEALDALERQCAAESEKPPSRQTARKRKAARPRAGKVQQ